MMNSESGAFLPACLACMLLCHGVGRPCHAVRAVHTADRARERGKRSE